MEVWTKTLTTLRWFRVVSFCEFCVRFTQAMVFVYLGDAGYIFGGAGYSSMTCSFDAKQRLASILDFKKLHRNSLTYNLVNLPGVSSCQ